MQQTGWRFTAAVLELLLVGSAFASIGDRLPEFKECLATCHKANCADGPTSISLLHRLLLWNCASTCDYTCQHIVTSHRLSRTPPYLHPVEQFHGKWPFHRFLGLQEPFSVLFSLLNLFAHLYGLNLVKERIPKSYKLRKYYLWFGYVGVVSWVASSVFHARDYVVTERADYFAAGMNVLFGLFLAGVRIGRLDLNDSDAVVAYGSEKKGSKWKKTMLRLWTVLCLGLYTAHVSFLSFVRWDYTYNMAANIVVGAVGNLAWIGYSVGRWYGFGKSGNGNGKGWMLWPTWIVLWVIAAMSMEVLEFVPWRLMVDAHSLWHLGTVGPTVWWYWFLVKDAEDDLMSARLKA